MATDERITDMLARLELLRWSLTRAGAHLTKLERDVRELAATNDRLGCTCASGDVTALVFHASDCAGRR